MSERQTDLVHMVQLAELRRKAKALQKAYRLRIVEQHMREYEPRHIAQRLGVSRDVVSELISELRKGKS